MRRVPPPHALRQAEGLRLLRPAASAQGLRPSPPGNSHSSPAKAGRAEPFHAPPPGNKHRQRPGKRPSSPAKAGRTGPDSLRRPNNCGRARTSHGLCWTPRKGVPLKCRAAADTSAPRSPLICRLSALANSPRLSASSSRLGSLAWPPMCRHPAKRRDVAGLAPPLICR